MLTDKRLIITGIVTTIWMRPLMTLTYGFIELALTPLRLLVN